MSNVIQIKHGQNNPGNEVLKPYELGFVEYDDRLIIGTNEAYKEIKVDYAARAGLAGYSTSAKSADYAINAGKATNATNAENAGYANKAGDADYAANAGQLAGKPSTDYASASSVTTNTASIKQINSTLNGIQGKFETIENNLTSVQKDINDLKKGNPLLIANNGFNETVAFSTDGWANPDFNFGPMRTNGFFEYASKVDDLEGVTGWKILSAGYVLLSASLYIRNNGGKRAGVYIYIRRGGSSIETISSYQGNLYEGTVNSGMALRPVQSGDIIYVKARAENGASASCNPNHSTSSLMILYV